MKYFKHWVKESFQIKIDGSIENINILSGSNISKADASQEAQTKADLIEGRISEGTHKENYEVAIKEHVDEVLDESNVVTVCRYGAHILNTQQYTILDLDDYPVNFMDIFKSFKNMTKKERIVHKFLENIKRHPKLGNDFRIYETTKGVRVIGKTYIDPTQKNYSSLMRKLGVDWIYIQLSKKQQCFRARLTPKPYRIKCKTIKIRSPLDCETKAYESWASQYKEHAKDYSVVKLIQTIGQDFSYEAAIKLHDETCNLRQNYKLA